MRSVFIAISSVIIVLLSMAGCKTNSEKPVETIAVDTTAIVSTPILSVSGSEGKPVSITKSDFLKLVMNYETNPNTWVYAGKKPCIIDFYADWCAPCKMTAPIIDELAKEYAGKVDFYKVDVEKERELASYMGISSLPTFLACPLKGNPSLTAGVGRTREETKKMFVTMINEITK